MEPDSSSGYDLDKAWHSGHPFKYVKTSLYIQAIHSEELDSEYPNDEIFNTIATKMLIVDAFKTNRKIRINYKWEPLDDNIIIYSTKGKILFTDITINDDELGFVIDSEDSDSVMAFSYRKIFWLEEE